MAKVYVGTYAKYNSGSIDGAWINLNECENYATFLNKCAEVHKDEEDPEFMIQDISDFPDGLNCLEWISEKDFNDIKEAMKEEDSPKFEVVNYSDKAIAVIGDTKEIKNELKKLGGRFNRRLTCGAGWIFPKSKLEMVNHLLNQADVHEVPECGKSQEQDFKANLIEFADGDSYYGPKNFVGAIKIGNGFVFIEKPKIDNMFCFHDEGPNYDLYCSLMKDEKKLEKYFLEKNLRSLDSEIEEIQNHEEVFLYSFCLNKRILDVGISSDYNKENIVRELTKEEKETCLNGLKWGRDLFEKRLHAYLKRWGVSKIKTWTYWADA